MPFRADLLSSHNKIFFFLLFHLPVVAHSPLFLSLHAVSKESIFMIVNL